MIEFENVSFSYTGQEHGGLHDINLKISDGECVLDGVQHSDKGYLRGRTETVPATQAGL